MFSMRGHKGPVREVAGKNGREQMRAKLWRQKKQGLPTLGEEGGVI